MEALITGLVLAGMSGLTVLAFQNQAGFGRLFPFVLAGASALFVAIVVWHVAVIYSWVLLEAYVDETRVGHARALLKSIQLPYLWIAAGYPSFVGYLWLLRKLPPFLKETGKIGADRPVKKS